MTIQNLWNAAKVVLRGYFREIQVYLKKQEKYQTPKATRERRTSKTHVSRRKEIIKIKTEMKER